jgi:hypothetical protein
MMLFLGLSDTVSTILVVIVCVVGAIAILKYVFRG